MTNFVWSEEKRKAAQLLAEGRLRDSEIAAKVDVDRKTLWRWQQDAEFSAEVDRQIEGFRQEVRRVGLAQRERRIAALNDRWNRLQRIIEERADSPQMANVPGGKTGLIVHNVKGVGKGDDFQLIDLYEVDTALLNELRQHEKQAAQELGQWVEQQAVQQTLKAYSIEASPETLWPPQPNASTSPEAPPSSSGAT